MYDFLSDVSPPMLTRQRVLSSDFSLDNIFPKDRLYRTLYSIQVLTSHLGECNKLGVADQQFILHGAKLLSRLLLDPSRPISGIILLKCLPSLVDFLQGTSSISKSSTRLRFADIPPERPLNSPPPPYLENAKELGFLLLEITECVQQMSFPAQAQTQSPAAPALLSVRAQLTRLAYSVILQLARTDGLWPEIENSEDFINAHRQTLLSKDASVSHSLAILMGDFLKEKRELATKTYMNTLVALLPDAMGADCSTTGFFSLFGEVIWADRHTSSDDHSIRSLVDKLATHVFQYQHIETPDLAVADRTLFNLLSLLNIAIDVLKSFKKPLQLGGLAKGIYDGLLFSKDFESPMIETETEHQPSSMAGLALRASTRNPVTEGVLPEPTEATTTATRPVDRPTKPVCHKSTRAVCLDIVRKLCDGTDDYAWLLERVTQSVQYAKRMRGSWFPTGQHLRGPEACSGLSNLGMTCYMNSLLQQIYSNIEFRKFVFDTPVVDPSKPDLLWHVKRLFAQMQNLDQPWVDTQDIANYLNICVDTQEDVHGFYTIFMSSLESCLPDPSTRAAFNGMFSGKLATQVQGSCGHVSSRTEPFSDLSITVQNKSSLADSLAEFVQGEPMQGANKYKCLSCDPENGGKLVDAMRRTCLEDVPDHLTVCLKRFTFDMMGQESKNNDFFAFPEEIDLSKFERKNLDHTDGATESDVFRLVGVIVHSGILTFGHYWSYVRLRYPDPRVSEWVRLEDTNFRSAKGFDEVQNECYGGNNRTHNGYVLFYQRESSFENPSAATIPAPCGVSSMAKLPPRVELPDDLFQQMHSFNAVRHRTAQLFDQGFHGFVLNIISDFQSRVPEAIPTAESSPTSEVESKSEDQEVVTPASPLCASLAKLAMKYIEHVLLSESQPEKLAQFKLTFQLQALSQPKLSHCLIAEICNDPSIFLQTLDHENHELRRALQGMMKDCLTCIKEQDRENYADDVTNFVYAHSERLDSLEDRHRAWFDYFSLALEVSHLGAFEAELVLNASYCNWIVNVAFCVFFEPAAFPHLPNLRDAARKHRLGYGPLMSFLFIFLQKVNAFDDIKEFNHGGKFGVLRPLLAPVRPGFPLRWMELASSQSHETTSWTTFPASRLIQSIVASPDLAFRKAIAESLVRLLQRDEPYSTPVYYMVAAFVEASGENKLSTRVLTEIGKGVKEHERPPVNLALNFFETVLSITPCAATIAISAWAPDWLLPRYKVSKRTRNWLDAHLFAAHPLTKDADDGEEAYGSALDVARSSAVRELVRVCEMYLEEEETDVHGPYAQLRAVLQHASNYLRGLVNGCERVKQAGARKQTEREREKEAEEEAADAASAEQEAEPITPCLTEAMVQEFPRAALAVQSLGFLLRESLNDDAAAEQALGEDVESSAFDESDDEDEL